KSRRLQLRGNRILGARSVITGLRGDAIRLWETRDSVLEHNEIAWARDIVIWYSPHNVVRHNRISHSRYGTHFMYSGDNVFADNHVESCVVGLFVMYSRGIHVTRNRLVDASGAAGMGVGLKESGNITLQDNLFVHDSIGLYIDTSPLYLGDVNRIERNRFRLSGTAVTFHGRSNGNTFVGNELAGNRKQVDVEGGGDARESHWAENWFDDYVGYDLDDDGVGDVPYTLRSLSGQLTARFPQAQYFHGSPALAIVEAISSLVPLVTPRTLIVDQRPRTTAPRASAASVPTPEGSHAG
ncbi:MAG: nosD, partial [Caulobacteraceae bacterium]